MHEFSNFCNTCHCSTEKLLNISVHREKRRKHILFLLIQDADIIKAKAVYVCLSCYEQLDYINSFRDMCLEKFLQCRKAYFQDTQTQNNLNVTSKLQSFIHENVLKTLHSAKDNNDYSLSEKVQVKSEALNEDVIFQSEGVNKQSEINGLELEDNISRVKEQFGRESEEEMFTDKLFHYSVQNENKTEFFNNCNNLHDLDKIIGDIKLHTEIDLENNDDELEYTNNEDCDQVSSRDEFASENKEQILTDNEIYKVRLENVRMTTFIEGSLYTCDEIKKVNKQLHSEIDLDNIHGEIELTSDMEDDNIDQTDGNVNNSATDTCRLQEIIFNKGNLPEEEIDLDNIHHRLEKGPEKKEGGPNRTNNKERCEQHVRQRNKRRGQKTSYKSDSNEVKTSMNERICNTDRPFKRTDCNKCFLGASTFNVHKRSHTDDRSSNTTVGNKAFSLHDLSRHKSTYNGNKPHKYNVCDKTLNYKCVFNSDKRPSSGKKSYNCAICNKVFSYLCNLNAHNRIHTGEKPYKCAVCNKAFSQSTYLIQHKRAHSGERPYKCTVCHKAFSQKGNFNVHKQIHSGKWSRKCTACDKVYAHGRTLNVYKRIHTCNKRFKCTNCNKAFRKLNHLIQHTRIHTGERPYKCTVCDKAFSQKSNLNVHKRIHTGEKPYKCTVCNKVFSRSHHLIQHKRIHTREKLNKCTVCNEDFAQSTH